MLKDKQVSDPNTPWLIKHNQHKFYFEGNTLEELVDYKYLGIDFN